MSFQIPERTRLDQARASNPESSAWVSANAGSGKTHVLAQRVIRLLLNGAEPGKILCLTFTKAAAANMADRVFQTLSAWTALDDAALRAAILATGAPPPDAGQLRLARKLFARAVETPGGLKIQTLHAFCERVLHAAPFEANVAAGFVVLEDADQAELVARARAEILAGADHNPELGAALARVAEDAGLNFDKILQQALSQRRLFSDPNPENFGKSLAPTLGLLPGETRSKIFDAMLRDGDFAPQWLSLAKTLDAGKKTDRDNAAALRAADQARRDSRDDEALEHLTGVFFTRDGGKRTRLLTGDITKPFPDLVELFATEQERLAALREKLKSVETLERSAALHLLAGAMLNRYQTLKNRRQAMDYEDLITATQKLFARSSAAWVLKKLDDGIDHILVDEAQDTSEAQWAILDSLTGDFYAGAGQKNSGPRTFFAVGDEKQSIFSFQGAAPKIFAQKSNEFSARVKAAGQNFEAVELTLSFRSAAGVLRAVDDVFSRPENFAGLSARPEAERTVHQAVKTKLPALVELWEVIAPREKPPPADWKLPLDFRDETDPPVASAKRIAALIADWLTPGSPERVMGAAGPRHIAPGDVMILVRRRDAFFHAMIRALREAAVPTSGADRLKLGEHIAVLDLIAIGRAALTPADDLTLACALKSPLFGFDDEDLLRLAPRRPSALWDALRESDQLRDQQAAARLARLAEEAGRLTPFGFFARLLGPRRGRRAFIARLGPEAGDALDEFLNLALAHERGRAPSLTGFLDQMAGLELEIKRDMDVSAGFVRVMTIHAAKGLEGKIVFLPDVCGAPQSARDSTIFALPGAKGALPVWSPKKAGDAPAVAAARAERAALGLEEYRRLLYVALTRAEERLYIAGHRGKNAFSAESWRAMIEATLLTRAAEHPAPWNAEEKIWRFGEEDKLPAIPPDPKTSPNASAQKFVAPAWLSRPARAEQPANPPLRPSSALEGADAAAPRAPLAPRRAEALEQGRQIHRLLQYLPDLPADQRRDAARRDAESRGFTPEQAEKLAKAALGVIENPVLAPLFGPQSFAELRIAAKIEGPDGGGIEILGAIDRLAETPDAIWIADFKTGAPRAELRARDLAQLALYGAAARKLFADKPIRAVLIFSEGPRVEEIPAEILATALAAALASAPKKLENF